MSGDEAPGRGGGLPSAPLQDWYEVLHVSPGADDRTIAAAAERLTRQSAALATTSPERSQQLRDIVRSIRGDLMAGPAARAHYDETLTASKATAFRQPPTEAARGAAPISLGPSSRPLPRFDPQTGAPLAGAVDPASGSSHNRSVEVAGEAAPASWPTPFAAQPNAAPARPNALDSVVNGIAPLASRFRRFLQTGWRCPSCGVDGGPGDKFCSKCGASMKIDELPRPTAPLHVACANCGVPLSREARFCTRCGTSVA
jgi:Double zinc ribbon